MAGYKGYGGIRDHINDHLMRVDSLASTVRDLLPIFREYNGKLTDPVLSSEMTRMINLLEAKLLDVERTS